MTAVVQTRGLSKRYGDVRAVDAVDLRVDAGEIYAFLGLNGAGKTTTIRMLLGMVRATAGDEPANALDPAGVVEVRGLLQALARAPADGDRDGARPLARRDRPEGTAGRRRRRADRTR